MKKQVLIIMMFSLFIPFLTFADGLENKLTGKILLQVEGRGEAWYVSPKNNNKHYMGTPEDAFNIMKEHGYGVTMNDLWKIEIGEDSYLGVDKDGDGLSDDFEASIGSSMYSDDTDNDGIKDKQELDKGYMPSGNIKINIDKEFAEKQKGKILLQVESRGEAWYVNPGDGKRYFLAKPENAFDVIRKFGLGVKNSDLETIPGLKPEKVVDNSMETAKEKIINFVNTTLLNPGSTAIVEKIEEEYGLYKFTIKISNGDSLVSYATKDAKLFFPQVMNIDEIIKDAGDKIINDNSDKNTVAETENKTSKPHVELFVMSHCPFGTQIEKGIIPVVELLGEKIEFDLKFVDYAMHGDKEIYEQLNQYCIQENEEEKLLTYLECFLKEGDGESCLTEVGIDIEILKECQTKTDDQYNVTGNYQDKSSWLSGRYPKFNVHSEECDKYDVQGSPSLVVNGEKINSGRNSSALLEAVCNYFVEKPSECGADLSTENPSPGFGYNASNSGSEGSCS